MMTESPVPADAVQIAASVLGYETHSPPAAGAVVAKLARRYAFVEHGRLAALEAVAAATESFLFDWYAASKPAEEVLPLAQALATFFDTAPPGPTPAEDAAFTELVQLGQEIEGGGK